MFSRKSAIVGAAAAAMSFGAISQAATVGQVIQDGADRIVETQHTDGLWGWPLVAPPTYSNITGPIGIGLVTAYGKTNDADHLAAAKAAGDALVNVTDEWVGTYNPEFLVQLSNATAISDPTASASYITKAQEFYTQLDNGTYSTSNHTTSSFISTVQATRTGAWVNLRPWEMAPLAIAASTAGNTAQRDEFVQAIKDGINTLDASAVNGADLLGLAGGLRGLILTGETSFDPTSGAFASASSIDDLLDTLAGHQNDNGSWYWSSNIALPDAEDEDTQATAYALLALHAGNTGGQYDSQILKGQNYLMNSQLVTGGWLDFPGGAEVSELNGEVVWALSVVPEPGAWGLVGLAGLGLLARRPRRKATA